MARVALSLLAAAAAVVVVWLLFGPSEPAPKPAAKPEAAAVVARIEPRPVASASASPAPPSPSPSEEPKTRPPSAAEAETIRKMSGAKPELAEAPSPTPATRDLILAHAEPKMDPSRLRDPPPPRDMRPLPGVSAAALSNALDAVKRCSTMQECVEAAGKGLALFGVSDPLPQPGPAKKGFDEARSTYRRAQAQVLRSAKDLSARPGGEARTEWLRSMFEAMPSFQSWELDDAEILPIRRALEKSIAKWVKDQRVPPAKALALRITVLTAGGPKNPVSIDFNYAREDAPAGMGELLAVLKTELGNLPKVAQSAHQQRAAVKMLLNPGGSFTLD
ncbi:MAG: hypothetical protein U1E65_11425 [Myxococcota bacterium]